MEINCDDKNHQNTLSNIDKKKKKTKMKISQSVCVHQDNEEENAHQCQGLLTVIVPKAAVGIEELMTSLLRVSCCPGLPPAPHLFDVLYLME